VSISWFYKWITCMRTPTDQRRAEVDAAVTKAFSAARGLHGSPRLHLDLREVGWAVSEKTVATPCAARSWSPARSADATA
jgi:putative transposase